MVANIGVEYIATTALQLHYYGGYPLNEIVLAAFKLP